MNVITMPQTKTRVIQISSDLWIGSFHQSFFTGGDRLDMTYS